MDEPMTPDRFRALADAYGGVVARWPEAERGAAMRTSREPFAAAALADALALDQALDGWRVHAPSRVLADRIAGRGVRQASGGITRLRLWWSGIGIAAALAGAAAGIATVALAAPGDGVSATMTSFGDVSGRES